MDDTISRRAAIETLDRFNVFGYVEEPWEKLSGALQALPSAQPKPPKAIRPKFVAEDRYLKNHFQTFPHCPKCNYELETGDCYCRVCGCHIDWSEDDE